MVLQIFLPLFYFLIFLFLIQRLNFFKEAGFSARSLQLAFTLKALSGLVIFLLYTYYYPNRLEADTFKYFDDSKPLYNALWNRPGDFFKMMFGYQCENQYFFEEYYTKMYNWYRSYDNGLINDNRLVVRVNAIFRLFSFGNYHVHSLFMNFLCLLGSYRLAQLFYVISESKWRSYFAVFLLPSFVFWSSGILKEAILIFALGIFSWQFYQLMKGSRSIVYYVSLPVLFLVLVAMKMYVFVALFPALIAWRLSVNRKRTIAIFIGVFAFFVGMGLLAAQLNPKYDFIHIMADKQHDFIRLAEALEAKSAIPMSYLDYSLWSFLKATPDALLTCFTRPWPTELKSVLFLPPLFENALLLGIIGLALFYRKKITPNQWKFLVFSIAFSVVLFAIIGLTTPILGAVVRYKIPALPFLVISGLLLLDSEKLPVWVKNNTWLRWINTHL